MMDLTPLDVRKKKGDFRRGIRGYEQAQVDDFLELVADRMEVLVRQASSVGDRIARLEQQVADYRDREKALTEALVSAQQMREDIRTQSTREVDLLRRQAEQEAEQIRAEAVRMRDREEQALEGLRSRQSQFLASYRNYLEQELAELAAVAQGLEMHTGRGARRGTGYSGADAARPTPPPFEPPAATTSASPPVQAPSFRDATGPVAGPAASPAQSPAGSAPFAAPAAPSTPAPFTAPAPSVQPSTPPADVSPERSRDEGPASAASGRLAEPSSVQPAAVSPQPAADSGPSGAQAQAGVEEDASEPQLEEALARWEPELGPQPQAPAAAPADEAELDLESDEAELDFELADEAELELESADEAELELESAIEAELDLESDVAELELETADDDDLLLSAADELPAAAALSSEQPVESEDDVDLAFLEFGEDDGAPVADPAEAAAAAEAVEREVSAALVESDGDYIDMGTAFGDDADEIELPIDAIADAAEPPRDEADEAIDAAFDFDGGGSDGLAETRTSEPRVAESASGQAGGPDDDRAADIEFVDSLLMDAGSMFEEEPPESSHDQTPPAPVNEASPQASADPFEDGELDDIAAEADRTDDYGMAEYETAKASDPDLIDLDSFRGFSRHEPPAASTGDVSSLTLHPMFFEQDPSGVDGEEQEESRQDHWSSSGGG